MKIWKLCLSATVLLLVAGQAAAQSEEEERLREAEVRELEMEEKLRAAEARLEEAAREIAVITKERLPRLVDIEQRYAMTNKPMLGVTIETSDEPGPVEGIGLLGVTPGSAASDAGLRSGDILTSINGEPLNAASCKEANMRLMDFMKGVEEGDVLTVEYLRDGKVGSVEVEPHVMAKNSFVWFSDDGKDFKMRTPPVAPHAIKEFNMQFGYPWVHTGLGDLELVELNEGLGQYFGTDQGLLVVRAPKSDAIDIRDGDVIQSIDGREPKDTRHAMRILSSYQGGEKLQLGIMRNKKKLSVDIEIPADHRGNLMDEFKFEVYPAAAPRAPVPIEPVPMVVPVPAEAPSIIVDVSS